MTMLNLTAIDLGADSGRLVLGHFDGERVRTEELHRFASHPVRLPTGLHIDVAHIWREIGVGLQAVAAACGGRIDGVGVDTWGVDFALLDGEGGLLGLPYHYRDPLSAGMCERACARMPREEIFAATGLQFMSINSLYQLLALAEQRPSLMQAARRLLFMPDLFTYWLGGGIENERTIASTSQCYDPVKRDWAWRLLDRFELPRGLFGPLLDPGSVAGTLRPEIASAAGLGSAPVLAPAGHDTALAVAAVPARGDGFAYISSGTWSLLGAELPAPLMSGAACAAGFTNEVGVCGTVRFLKNLCGLWLVQESRRTWAEQGNAYSHAQLVTMAEAAPAWRGVVDVDAPEFARPGDMPARIASYCRRSGQSVPGSHGEIVRVALESLALKYRHVLSDLERLTGGRLEPLHIVGGGSQNRLLCQLAADATGHLVVAGPTEATALGNVLMQAMALGHLGSLPDLRAVVRRSADVVTYEPRPSPGLDDACARLTQLMANPPAPEPAR
jgi:rhamnulokinase